MERQPGLEFDMPTHKQLYDFAKKGNIDGMSLGKSYPGIGDEVVCTVILKIDKHLLRMTETEFSKNFHFASRPFDEICMLNDHIVEQFENEKIVAKENARQYKKYLELKKKFEPENADS